MSHPSTPRSIGAMSYRVEVRGTFGGATGGWRPAITGTLNQTGKSDAEASTFQTEGDAEDACGLARAELGVDTRITRARALEVICGSIPYTNESYRDIQEILNILSRYDAFAECELRIVEDDGDGLDDEDRGPTPRRLAR